jgi:DNA-directed RNA polymerase beta' subunit
MNDTGSSSRKKGEKKEFDRQKATSDLQSKIWTLMDNRGEKSKLSSGGRPHKCLFQRIGGKEGHVQSNIGGKRADFTARSVIIGGGTNIAADEVGVPKLIAEELTKRVLVTKWNIKGCQKLIFEGKVNRVARTDRDKNYERVIRLKNQLENKTTYKLEIGDNIERYLRDGDWVVVNRQPTLRQESMIALKVKIVEGLAIQLPLNVCQCLNADFDGDEINIHVPQSPQAIAEVEELLKMSRHIISPQNNSPIASVIQDGAIGVYLLTNTWLTGERETMISKDIFQDCLEKTGISLSRYHDLLQRAYMVYHNGYAELKCKYREEQDSSIKKKYKEDAKQYKEFCKYITHDKKTDTYDCANEIPGKLMVSILFPPVFCYQRTSNDNDIYPVVKITHGVVEPTSGPLNKKECKYILHYLWKEHSTQHATMFLTEVQRLVYNWQPHHGFSMGLSDCMPTSKEEIAKTLSETQAKVADILSNQTGEIDVRTEAEINRILNDAMNIGAKLAKTSMNKGDRNALNIMRMSGAKGSLVNLIQIIAFVGQQNIDGKRMPRTLSNGTRSLPHFLPGDNSPEARGFISNSYIDGLTPEQAFNHAASGRQGVISTAIKTADSGYIQKRIGRKVEDLKVMMDGSVRDAAGNIIQFLYGDDGMDAKKLYACKDLKFPFFVNVFSIADKINSTAIRSEEVTDEDEPRHLRPEEIEVALLFIKIGPPGVNTPVIERVTENFKDVFRQLLPKVKIYECKIGDYFREIKCMLISSKIEYGDMVGLVAASSIGEPTTQLTLNFFHLAGVGGKDVSLGVPRLNELLNITKPDKQKKPSCTVYLNNSILKSKSRKVHKLEEKKQTVDEGSSSFHKIEKTIQETKEEALMVIQDIKKTFEETTVETFLIDFKMMYIPSDVSSEKGMNPIKILTYEEYEEKWWVSLAAELGNPPVIVPESWVVLLEFDKEKLFTAKVTLEEIVLAIEEEADNQVACVPSPDVIGQIEVYFNFSCMKKYVKEKKSLPTDSEGLNEDNIDFFVCRDAIMSYIKKTHISGISRISKVYPREDPSTNEWILDTAGSNFLQILNVPGVDTTRTISDDVWAVNEVLGIMAARKFLIEELTRVISFDGTYINPRHIQLLVDRMTYTGDITAARRDGISREIVGPIAKIMFEQQISNSSMAAISTEVDLLQSVSSSVMYGTSAEIGTAAVDVQDPDKIPIRPPSVPLNNIRTSFPGASKRSKII